VNKRRNIGHTHLLVASYRPIDIAHILIQNGAEVKAKRDLFMTNFI
jgi:hypothetical protein